MRIIHQPGEYEGAVVLVVDDEEPFRQSIARILTERGYSVVEAASSAEAGERFAEEHNIDVVLCDIRMPGESGLDLLARLTSDEPHVAVVMTTGIDEPETAAAAFDIGADGYLVKPFTTNELLITMRNGQARRRSELVRQHHVRGLEQTISRLQAMTALLNGLDSEAAHPDEDTIERLSRALSFRDEETGWHLERMSRFSALLAEAVGHEERPSSEVRMATALHDVGKIGVADSILRKPGPLSADELASMQRHPQIGYQMLAGSHSDLLDAAGQAALCHHEWWDGGGYPRGLRGDQIPEIARIAAVADVFDALTSNRVYRPGLAIEAAIDLMRSSRGRQFEPRLLDAFLELGEDIAEIREAFPDAEEGPPRIRVLVVDDHQIFVESLVRLLHAQPKIRVVGTASGVSAAQDAVTLYLPDVVLMDFELPDGDGVTAAGRIRTQHPQTKVVMLTGSGDQHVLARAIGVGCAGFVAKTEGIDTLVEAVQAAFDGESLTAVVDLPQVLGRLDPTRRGLGNALGAREREVLRLVATGLPNKLIARRLCISLNTVRNHVQSILYKLDAHSRLEAVATGVREGIIDWESTSVG
jgi:putative two-component system response regulator